MIRNLLIFSCFIIVFSILSFPVSAQSPTARPGAEGSGTLGVARMVEMSDAAKNAKDGSIVSAGTKGAILTIVPYDSQTLGVVSRDAAIILSTSTGKSGLPVISTGTVYVLVSSKDGNIAKGDLVASSNIPGVASKATKEGFVLGSAVEGYSSSDPKKVDKIAISLDLHYFNSKPTFPGSLSDIFKLVLIPTKEGPNPIFKYIVAAIVVLGSMILGFLTFGRASAKGVEALGRNPAAGKIIQLGIIFNVAIVIAIALAGLGVAFLILRL